MPRDISTGMAAPLATNYIRPCFLLIITFRSQTVYAWSGVGDLIYAGNTYKGIGDLGKFAPIVESDEPQAFGNSVTLNGIDPALLSESMNDIQQGAPAAVYLAVLDSNGAIYGTPYPAFVGTVDQPIVEVSTKTLSITLALENKLANLMRANQIRYTQACQGILAPGDTFFQFVEGLNDIALRWNA
ncbi:MAG TPA: hypothetical protein VII58_00800 [Acidobacteriaceae bacterium]